MSDWSIIPTRALVEAEYLLSDIADSSDLHVVYLRTKEVKKLINEGVSCNVKPEAVK
jgi:hypothetical protein